MKNKPNPIAVTVQNCIIKQPTKASKKAAEAAIALAQAAQANADAIAAVAKLLQPPKDGNNYGIYIAPTSENSL